MGMDNQKSRLDLEHLSRQTMGDEALSRQVLSIFIDHATRTMPQLEAATDDLARLAHGLKGSAKGIGAWDVAGAAEALEKTEGNPADAIRSLKQAVDATVDEIGRYLTEAR